MPAASPAVDRFWAKVSPEPNSGCWLWTASGSSSFDYGRLNVGGRIVHANRFAWELHHGRIPDGLRVLHRCDVPACCNPAHLFLGTQADNVRDMHSKGRDRNQFTGMTHCKRGHELAGANLYLRPNRPGRICRACNLEAQKRYASRQQ